MPPPSPCTLPRGSSSKADGSGSEGDEATKEALPLTTALQKGRKEYLVGYTTSFGRPSVLMTSEGSRHPTIRAKHDGYAQPYQSCISDEI